MIACMQAAWKKAATFRFVLLIVEALIFLVLWLWLIANALPWFLIGLSWGFIAIAFTSGRVYASSTTKFLTRWVDNWNVRLDNLPEK